MLKKQKEAEQKVNLNCATILNRRVNKASQSHMKVLIYRIRHYILGYFVYEHGFFYFLYKQLLWH